jgi:uncharacterized membrane protein YbaN (DUF454 family)
MSNADSPHQDPPQVTEEFADCAPAREPSVVHSGFGRLRIHLPHWSGTREEDLAAALRGLPGVTHAEANPLTGNVLLLFEPQQTSAATLLEALPALRLAPPLSLPGEGSVLSTEPFEAGQLLVETVAEGEAKQPGSVVYMTGTGRVVYKALGWSSVGMAGVGAATPGIPTAPFVILAGYFFVRSSPESHQWLRQSRWFGPLLRDWEDHRGVRRSVRNAALGLIGGSMVVTTLLGLATPLLATILTLQAVGMGIVLRLRVIDPTGPAPAAG